MVVTKNGKYAYTTNAGTSVVSGYRVGRDGSLTLLTPDGNNGATGAGPIDADFSKNDRFLYTLNSRAHSISVFRVEENGALAPVQELAGVAATAMGVAAN